MTHLSVMHDHMTGCALVADNVVFMGAKISKDTTQVDCNHCRKSKAFLKLSPPK